MLNNTIVKAKKDVIGINVKNNERENLGKIYEIMLDKFSGRVAYIVLESGSFLGLGGKLVALPWNSIHYDPIEECFIVDMDKQELENAPEFSKDDWPECTDKSWGASVYDYYGAKSYWE